MIRPLACALLLALGSPLTAQSAGRQLEDARQAYLVLDLDRARELALGSLERPGSDTLTDAQRADALMLLGTIATLQERPTEARQRFRALLLFAPRYVPDSLTTPSEPLQAFREARESVKATALELARPQNGVGPTRPFRATVLVSSLHDVLVTVLDDQADTVDVLWAGPIRDAADVSWVPGPDATGDYLLVSASRLNGVVTREVRVPLHVVRQHRDTLPWPVAPPLVPTATVAAGDAWRPLVLGVAVGAAVVFGPLVAGPNVGTPGRLIVAGGLGAGGVAGYLRARHHRQDAAAVATNATGRAAWERERQRVAAENDRRRQQYAMDIVAGPATSREPERP